MTKSLPSIQMASLKLLAVATVTLTPCLLHAPQQLPTGQRRYLNTLTPIKDPQPLLADFPEFVAPIVETRRYEAPILVDDPQADLSVRAWRFSYNARGIIELPNRLRADQTAVTAELAEEIALGVEQARHPVAAAGQDQPSIGRKTRRVHDAPVPRQPVQLVALQVPDPCRLVS